MRSRFVLGLLVVSVVLGLAAPATAADSGPALRVVVVQTSDLPGYLAEIEKGRALLKKMGSVGVIRVWRAQFAGENAGSVVVSIEYPTLSALAQDMESFSKNTEYRAWLAGLDKYRKVVSDSVYREQKS